MKIGILGSGMIGSTVARLFAGAGHEVIIGNSRGPESLRPLVSELGPHARAGTTDEVARHGDVIFLAVPWRTPEALPAPERVAGKIVIDAMNPYANGGGTVPLGDSTSSEETAKRLPTARIVKAFNTIFYQHLATQGQPQRPADQRRAIFVSGDDQAAKTVVIGLIDQLGFGAVDAGSLRDGGRLTQPGSALYNVDISAGEAKRILAAKP